MGEELKPCPCCGAAPLLVKKEGFGPAGARYSRGYVRCRKCDLTTPTKSPWEKAAERWNRRTSSLARSPEPVAWRWKWKTTGSPLEQRFADPDLYAWSYRDTKPTGEPAAKMDIEPLYTSHALMPEGK